MFDKHLVSSIRILPSDKITFNTEADFKYFIENTMKTRGGYYYFPNLAMNCPINTLVLFQYDGMIRAIGILTGIKKKPVNDERGIQYAGYYKFDIETLKYLKKPIDKYEFKSVYPAFKSFSQTKQIVPLEYFEKIKELLQQINPNLFVDAYELTKTIRNIEAEIDNSCFEGKVKETLIKIRINQSVFREKLLHRYGNCCLCGINNPTILIASHIKPWKDSKPDEKLDVDNGLLLCANHDKLFDSGLITFDNDGRIIISDHISILDRILLNISENMKIKLTEKNKEYLKFHRNTIFKDKAR